MPASTDWPLPSDAQWSALGVVDPRPLTGGHQSKVFGGTVGGQHVVVKLVPRRGTDRSALRERSELLFRLSTADPQVVAPLAALAPSTGNGQLVTELGDWLAMAFPFVEGPTPDPTSAVDVELMGGALARLHRHLARFPATELPPVRVLTIPGLDPQPPHAVLSTRPHQLLHGDYSPANLIVGRDGLRIVDFDDCGYGPVEFELGNTLFMALFDFTINDPRPHPDHRHRSFRRRLVASYVHHSGRDLDDELLDAAIELRLSALRHWLDRPSEAPAGIGGADASWRLVLERFVRSQGLPGPTRPE